MEEIDKLTPQTVKSGPLKAVLNRMTHRQNLDPSLRPDFTNDHEVTEQKIDFVQLVLTTNEEILLRDDSEQTAQTRTQKLGEIAALTCFLQGEKPEDIVTKHSVDTGRKENLRPRDEILSVASWATQRYSDKLRPAVTNDNVYEITAERRANHRRKTKAERPTVLDGFDSLHNTVIDLFEQGKLRSGNARYAQGLLLLFEQAESSASPQVREAVLQETRRRLRSHIDMSPALNRPREKDQELLYGKALLTQFLTPIGRSIYSGTGRYRKLNALEHGALMQDDNLQQSEVRAYIESRIAYVLHALYTDAG